MSFDQPIATLIAGIATAVGSTAVFISVVVFDPSSARAALHQQRLMAEHYRRWDQQRAVYQQLAEWLAGHRLAGRGDRMDSGARCRDGRRAQAVLSAGLFP